VDPTAEIALAEIQGSAPVADGAVLEAMAAAAHDDESLDVDDVAAAVGCEVRTERALPDGVDAVLLPGGIVLARPRRDARRVLFAILHELAHQMLIDAGIAHSHADVWRLTLALAAPLALLRRLRGETPLTLRDLHWSVQLPAWALRVRFEMLALLLAA
jgi:hypothetical protein